MIERKLMGGLLIAGSSVGILMLLIALIGDATFQNLVPVLFGGIFLVHGIGLALTDKEKNYNVWNIYLMFEAVYTLIVIMIFVVTVIMGAEAAQAEQLAR